MKIHFYVHWIQISGNKFRGRCEVKFYKSQTREVAELQIQIYLYIITIR
jgi:DNA gyrase inhibitor GyrI